tara:strand:+ start:219 stop:323 length:105 start_codon:yes stop_codon:yes gene_type:complete
MDIDLEIKKINKKFYKKIEEEKRFRKNFNIKFYN